MRYLLAGLLLCLWAFPAFAQREWDTWCVGGDACSQADPSFEGFDQGHGAQLAFGPGGPRLKDNAVRRYGSATCSDAQGNLLFYSNGMNVFDQQHRIMPGSEAWLSSPCMSLRTEEGSANGLIPTGRFPAYIATYPVPGQAERYYLFYFTVSNCCEDDRVGRYCTGYSYADLNYAVIDMRANGGYGAVVQRDMPLLQTILPKMTIVRHANNADGWIITHGLAKRGFRVLRISAAGISTEPVTSLSGEADYANGWVLSASPDGQHLASEGKRLFEGTNGHPWVGFGMYLYDFDNTTGKVSHERLIRSACYWDSFYSPGINVQNESYRSAFVGASFSPDSQLLYTVDHVIRQNDPSQGPSVGVGPGTEIAQYDITQPDTATIRRSRQVLTTVGLTNRTQRMWRSVRFSSLQLSSDGALWTTDWDELRPAQPPETSPFNACYGPKALTMIAHPNERGAACAVRLQALPLGPAIIDPWVLPNVVTNMLFAPTALLTKTDCDTVHLWANSQQTRPAGRWDFDDPESGPANTVTGYYVAHRFRRGGLHHVTLTYPDGLVLAKDLNTLAGDTDVSEADIITPNGDGLNDRFQPLLRAQAASTARLRVYSRWGRLVYESEGPAPAWAAEGSPEGVYFWQLSYVGCGGQPQQRKGLLTVAR